MLRTLLIAGALLTASGASFAHGGDYGFGRVISVEPNFVISFGSRYPDGYRVLYESGGSRYWTHTSYYPSQTIVLPPPQVRYVYYPRDYGRGWDERRGWGGHRGWDDRRGGDGRRDDRRDERREHRREHHRHGDD